MVILKRIWVLQLLITERSELVVDLTSLFAFGYTVKLFDCRCEVVIYDLIWFLESRLGYLVALYSILAAFSQNPALVKNIPV